MVLPGISREQMIEVDRIMMQEFEIPVELMMEHAGLNLARLAITYRSSKSNIFQVICGSGNNGGGGLVAARRLAAWGLTVEVFIPRGMTRLKHISKKQLIRIENLDVRINEGLPMAIHNQEQKNIILDAYIGYGFKNRVDEISEQVFEYLSEQENIIPLDTPSGLDLTSGKSTSEIQPRVTLTIAFVKEGLLRAQIEEIGTLYVVDIGVPMEVYQHRLEIEWKSPFDIQALMTLGQAFKRAPIHEVVIIKNKKPNLNAWHVNHGKIVSN